jgi:transmembrane sensor
MDYTKFSVEDFAANESFIDWVNQSDPEAVKYWELYIAGHPEIAPVVEKARTLVINLKRTEDIPEDDTQIQSIWAKIEARVEHKQTRVSSNRTRIAILASVIIVVSAGIWWQLQTGDSLPAADLYTYQNKKDNYAEQINETGKPLRLQLADGSIVTLQDKSRLKYKSDYTNVTVREVYLLGDAFFEVTKDPYRPFIVHTNEVLTKVLGTSFRIQAPEGARNIIVSVKTGKVSVYTASEDAEADDTKEGVILLPNQRVKYERAEQLFDKELVEIPEVVNPAVKSTDFNFDNTPIRTVFKVLEDAYGVEILYNEELMEKCFITAPLGSEPLFEKLKIICQTIGANYEVIDTRIIINSSGC